MLRNSYLFQMEGNDAHFRATSLQIVHIDSELDEDVMTDLERVVSLYESAAGMVVKNVFKITPIITLRRDGK